MQDLNLLIIRAQAGDLDAYSTIVQRFQNMAVGYGFSVLGDRQLAEDAAQEAFIYAFECLPSLRQPAAFSSWFRRIVFKQCDRILRRNQLTMEPLEAKLQSDTPTVAEVIEAQDLQQALLDTVDTLPENERAVVVLFYFGGYAQADIGKFLDIPLTTVKNRLYTARKRLKERMTIMTRQDFQPDMPQADDVFIDIVIETLRNRGAVLLAEYQSSADRQESTLKQSIDNLSQAFVLDNSDSETVWALIRSLRYISDIDGIIDVLKIYANHASNPEQEFLARHYLVDYYALMRRDTEAVEAHKRMLNHMQTRISADRLLWSLSDTTMLASWKRTDARDTWLSIAEAHYQRVPDTLETCQTRAEYLRTLTEAVYMPRDDYDRAEETCKSWMALIEKYSDQLATARWMLIDGCGLLLSIYTALGQQDQVNETVRIGLAETAAYASWINQQMRHNPDMASTELAEHWALCQNGLHNFGCQCLWNGYFNEAVQLLEQALEISENAETHFFLAAAILKATGNRDQSLDHFRCAIQNPTYSYRHDLKRPFLHERAFESVWNDPQFLSVIAQEADKLVQQGSA